MKVSQTELFGSVAVLLYIVFFSHSPPTFLRSALSNTIIAALVVAVIGYITLYQSRTIGVLLIFAFVLTMTRVTEHMEAPPPAPLPEPPQQPPTNTPVPLNPPASTSSEPPAKVPDASSKSTDIVENTTTTAAATPVPAPAHASSPPVSTAPAQASSPPVSTAPATPPVANKPPAPVMSCNIESFAPF